MSNIVIRPGAAMDDVMQIKNIVANIKESMELLENSIKRNIPANIETQWSERLRSEWESYYTNQIPASMVEMQASATNLEKAAEEAIRFSQGN